MGDPAMGERWNAIESTEMALGVRWAIDYIKRNEEPPHKYIQSLEKGIGFLEEAKAGGTLISSGSLDEAGSFFKGTFSPLRMATDVYVTFSDTPNNSEDYKKVSALLNKYKDALVSIKDEGLNCRTMDDGIFSDVEKFFETLFDILAQQSDPIVKEYSRPYAF
jgi:hypothetical protein